VVVLTLLSPLLVAGAALYAFFLVMLSPIILVDYVSHRASGPPESYWDHTSRKVLCRGRTIDQVLADAREAALAIGFQYESGGKQYLVFSRTREGGKEALAQLSVAAFEASDSAQVEPMSR
jgi:hypothetical protein